MLDHPDGFRDGPRHVGDQLVVLHVRPVPALCLEVEAGDLGFGGVPGELGDIVGDPVLVEEFLLVEGPVRLLPAEGEADPRVHDGLPFQHVLVVFPGDVDLGEDLEVRTPPLDGARAAVPLFEGLHRQFRHRLPLAEGDRGDVLPVVGGDLVEFGGVLCRAGAEPVQTEGVFVGRVVGVVVVLPSGVEFAVDKLPVPAALPFVPAEGDAPPVVFDLDGAVGKGGDADDVPVALPRLVHRVGEDLENRMLRAFQPVRAEDHRRPLPYPVRAFEGRNGLIVVGFFLFHAKGSFRME